MKKQTKKTKKVMYVALDGKMPGIYKDKKDADQYAGRQAKHEIKTFAKCHEALREFDNFCVNRKTPLELPLRKAKARRYFKSEEDYFAHDYLVRIASYVVGNINACFNSKFNITSYSSLSDLIYDLQSDTTCVIYMQGYSIYSCEMIDPQLLKDPEKLTGLMRTEKGRSDLRIFCIAENYRSAKLPDCDRILYLNLAVRQSYDLLF